MAAVYWFIIGLLIGNTDRLLYKSVNYVIVDDYKIDEKVTNCYAMMDDGLRCTTLFNRSAKSYEEAKVIALNTCQNSSSIQGYYNVLTGECFDAKSQIKITPERIIIWIILIGHIINYIDKL